MVGVSNGTKYARVARGCSRENFISRVNIGACSVLSLLCCLGLQQGVYLAKVWTNREVDSNGRPYGRLGVIPGERWAVRARQQQTPGSVLQQCVCRWLLVSGCTHAARVMFNSLRRTRTRYEVYHSLAIIRRRSLCRSHIGHIK